MPRGLKRFHSSRQSHFVTFSCYYRRPYLLEPARKAVFESALERVRRSCELCVYGYVVMPEHVHLLLSEPPKGTLADALKSLKQGVARRLIDGLTIGEAEHFWPKRDYDFNVRNHAQFVEKLRYIHRNPVKRGLCERPEDWAWSSFLQYATGCEGRVEIEMRVGGQKTRASGGNVMPSDATAPLKPKDGLNGAPGSRSKKIGRRRRTKRTNDYAKTVLDDLRDGRVPQVRAALWR